MRSGHAESRVSIDIARLIRQIPSQYPFVLVDKVLEHDPKGRLVALKNLTGSEEFFEGHFPGAPVMPGVLIMECLAQAAGIWLLEDAPDPSRLVVHVVGIDGAKFRRPVLPGDRLRLEVEVLRRRGPLVRVRGLVTTGEQRVAEARMLLQTMTLAEPQVHPTARVAPGAQLGPDVRIGPYSVVGPSVKLGARCVLDAHVVVDGHTYYLDLAWPQWMVAVECNDAGSHHTPKAFLRDPMKRNRCESAGWIYLEFTWWDMVHNSAEVVALIAAALQQAA